MENIAGLQRGMVAAFQKIKPLPGFMPISKEFVS